MIVADLIAALLIAFVLSLLFVAVPPGRRGLGFPAFFLLVLVATWVAGLWVQPFGPLIYGVAWLPFLMAGLLIALLLSAAVPPRDETPPRDRPGEAPRPASRIDLAAEGVAAIATVWLWIFIVVAGIAIVMAYV